MARLTPDHDPIDLAALRRVGSDLTDRAAGEIGRLRLEIEADRSDFEDCAKAMGRLKAEADGYRGQFEHVVGCNASFKRENERLKARVSDLRQNVVIIGAISAWAMGESHWWQAILGAIFGLLCLAGMAIGERLRSRFGRDDRSRGEPGSSGPGA